MDSKIIDKVLSKNASQDEARQVAEWFATDEGQDYLSQRYDRESFLLNDKMIEEWSDHDIPGERMKSRLFSKLKVQIRTVRFRFAAAVFIPFIMVIASFTFIVNRSGILVNNDMAEIAAPLGEHVKVILQDGTSVLLNSGSTLKYPKSFGLFNRKVKLNGEGYFVVAKERTRPFIVNIDEIEIKVTGTKFDVKGYSGDDQIKVALEEGSVNITVPSNNIYPMKAGQNAVYDRITGECSLSEIKDIDEYLAWRTKSLNFYRTPLFEILKTLERQYEIKFIVNDASLLDLKFSISTSKVNIESILMDLEKVSNIRFKLIEENNAYEVVSIE